MLTYMSMKKSIYLLHIETKKGKEKYVKNSEEQEKKMTRVKDKHIGYYLFFLIDIIARRFLL